MTRTNKIRKNGPFEDLDNIKRVSHHLAYTFSQGRETEREMMEKQVMTLDEVAEFFGKHPETAKRWLKKGNFPPHFVHEKTVYVKVTDFQEWLDQKIQASEPVKEGDDDT